MALQLVFNISWIFLALILAFILVIIYLTAESEKNIIQQVALASQSTGKINEIIKGLVNDIEKYRNYERIYLVSHSQGAFVSYEALSQLDEVLREKIIWIPVGSGLKPIKVLRGINNNTKIALFLWVLFISYLFAIYFAIYQLLILKSGLSIIALVAYLPAWALSAFSTKALPNSINEILNFAKSSNWATTNLFYFCIIILIIVIINFIVYWKLKSDSRLNPIKLIPAQKWFEIKSKYDPVSSFTLPQLPAGNSKINIETSVLASRRLDHVNYFNNNSSTSSEIVSIIIKNSLNPSANSVINNYLVVQERRSVNSLLKILLTLCICLFLVRFDPYNLLENIRSSSRTFITTFTLIYLLVLYFLKKNTKARNNKFNENIPKYNQKLIDSNYRPLSRDWKSITSFYLLLIISSSFIILGSNYSMLADDLGIQSFRFGDTLYFSPKLFFEIAGGGVIAFFGLFSMIASVLRYEGFSVSNSLFHIIFAFYIFIRIFLLFMVFMYNQVPELISLLNIFIYLLVYLPFIYFNKRMISKSSIRFEA